MPYSTTDELPASVKNVLPVHARDIFKEAFNNAYQEYKQPETRRGKEDREEVAFKVAWSAVKKAYVKDKDDKWRSKD